MLIESIKRHEGFRANVYKDTLGLDTVGWGFYVKALTPDELALNNGNFEPMSKEVADKILELKVEKLKKGVNDALPWLREHSEAVQNIIYEMAYQMGIRGMLSFSVTLRYIKARDYKRASFYMLQSRWAKQTNKRARSLSNELSKC